MVLDPLEVIDQDFSKSLVALASEENSTGNLTIVDLAVRTVLASIARFVPR